MRQQRMMIDVQEAENVRFHQLGDAVTVLMKVRHAHPETATDRRATRCGWCSRMILVKRCIRQLPECDGVSRWLCGRATQRVVSASVAPKETTDETAIMLREVLDGQYTDGRKALLTCALGSQHPAEGVLASLPHTRRRPAELPEVEKAEKLKAQGCFATSTGGIEGVLLGGESNV